MPTPNNRSERIIEIGSPEWQLMWGELANNELNKGDPVCEHPITGDSWKYISSSNCHSFHHRKHPSTKRSEVLNINFDSMLGLTG